MVTLTPLTTVALPAACAGLIPSRHCWFGVADSRIMSKERPKSAWVIEWGAIGTSLKIKRKILHVLNPRLHPRTVIKYMQCLYLNSEMASGMDRLASLSGDYWCGYMVINEWTRIRVGSNPFLVAWRVVDLTIAIDYDRGLEIFRWTQVPPKRINEETGKVEHLGEVIQREEGLPYH